MAVTTEIPWGDGTSDKIYLTRNASEGNQTVLVSSDANTGAARSKVVTFSASGVTPVTLTVSQNSSLPYDAEVEYLESADGGQYIDCGFKATNALSFTFDIYRKSSTTRWDCGSEEGWSAKISRLLIQEGNSSAYWRYASGGVTVTSSNNCIGHLRLSVNGRSVTISNQSSGNSYNGNATAGTFTTPGNFLLFAYTMGTSPQTASATKGIRLKAARITDGNIDLDLIPVRIGQVGYLYDRNSGTLFPNVGTGNFIVGSDVINETLPEGATSYDYLESDGTQYIDTGIGLGVSSSNLIIESQSQFLNGTGAYSWTLFALNTTSGNSYLGFQNNGTTLNIYNPGAYVTQSGWGYSKIRARFEGRQWMTNGTLRNEGNAFNLQSDIIFFTSTSHSNLAKARIWQTKIYVNGVIARDYKPCKDSEGRAAMYDFVTKTYYYGNNASGNDFSVGND